jgi:hypothetical protein
MRHLAQPKVMRWAAWAACATALACYPRFEMWQTRRLPIWYLELVLLTGTFFLWSFVFGWQGPYGGRHPMQVSNSAKLWVLATAVGLGVAGLHYFVLDPMLRPVAPDEYPVSRGAWLAMLLSMLTLTQLFVIYAPMAFFLRMISRRWLAVALTLAFYLFVLLQRSALVPTPMPPLLLAALIGMRLLGASALLYFYFKGGLPLACWATLLVHARLLLELPVAR